MAVAILQVGCSKEYYKQDADEEVYKILGEKWQDDFPSRANYRISDVARGPNDVAAPEVAAVRGQLALAEAVAIATAHNREYQQRKESLYLEALSLTLDRHAFAPQFFGLLGGGYRRDADDESLSSSGELGFDMLLAEGTAISASVASNWLRYLTGDPRTSLGSVLSATITQPLMRGAWREVVQEGLTQAERDVLYELRDFNRFRKTFVVARVADYYNVLRAMDQVRNAKDNYDSLTYIYERTRMMAQAGRVEPLRAGETLQDQLEAQDSYVRAQENYEQALDQYKISLGLPTEARIWLDPGELDALEGLAIEDPNYSIELIMAAAIEHRLDLATSADRVADAERKVIVAANGLAPELNLVASANVDTPSGQRFARFQFNEGSYALGLEFDPDLDRKQERNSYRQALISLTRTTRAYEQARDQVKFDARQAYRNLREAASVYEIRLLSLRLALQRVEGEQLKLEAGVGVTRDLLNAQRSLLQAQNDKTDALVGYTVARLAFARDLGVLDVRPDGLWELELP
jgi:outer membrane protein TolC